MRRFFETPGKFKYLHQWFWPGLSGSFVVWMLYDGSMNDQKIMISPNSPLMVASLSLSIFNIHYFTAAETTLTLNGRSSFCFQQWGRWIGSNWPITSLETVGSNIPTSHMFWVWQSDRGWSAQVHRERFVGRFSVFFTWSSSDS